MMAGMAERRVAGRREGRADEVGDRDTEVAIWKVTSPDADGRGLGGIAGATTMEIPMARPRRNLTTVEPIAGGQPLQTGEHRVVAERDQHEERLQSDGVGEASGKERLEQLSEHHR